MNELPSYDEGQIRHLELMAKHSEVISEAYSNYHQAVQQVITLHNLYFQDTTVKSNACYYRAALLHLEGARAFVEEIKDTAFKAGLTEWVP